MAARLVSPKSVRKITVVQEDGSVAVVHARKTKKNKRQSLPLKPFERVQRRLVEALHDGAGEYLDRHERSNEEKRDGWVKDMGKNMSKAGRKMMKAARKAVPGT